MLITFDFFHEKSYHFHPKYRGGYSEATTFHIHGGKIILKEWKRQTKGEWRAAVRYDGIGPRLSEGMARVRRRKVTPHTATFSLSFSLNKTRHILKSFKSYALILHLINFLFSIIPYYVSTNVHLDHACTEPPTLNNYKSSYDIRRLVACLRVITLLTVIFISYKLILKTKPCSGMISNHDKSDFNPFKITLKHACLPLKTRKKSINVKNAYKIIFQQAPTFTLKNKKQSDQIKLREGKHSVQSPEK